MNVYPSFPIISVYLPLIGKICTACCYGKGRSLTYLHCRIARLCGYAWCNHIRHIRCLAFLFKGNFYGVISIHITKGVACGCCHFRTIHLYVRNIISFVRLDCICKLTCGRYRCRATGRDCSTDTCRCGNLVACCTARRRYRRCILRKTPTSTEYHGCAV